MATSIGGIFATLGANVAGWSAGMGRAQKDVLALQGITASASARITSSISSLVSQVGGAVGVFGGLSALTFGVKLAAEMEQTEIAFAGLMGSTDKAKAHIADLQKFAASTPFNFRELVKADRQMMAMGFRANDTVGTLRILGDAVSGLGGNGQTLDRIILAFSQMNAKGKVSAQEMNQIAETGIPGWKLLADAIGVSIPKAMQLAEAGAISSSIAIDAILGGMNAKFGGNMAKQAGTLQGVFSNLVDVSQQKLTAFGAEIAKSLNLTNVVKAITANIDKVAGVLSSVAVYTKEILTLGAGFIGYATAAKIVSVAIWAVANATKAWAMGTATVAGLSGVGLAKLAAGVGAAYAVGKLLDSGFKDTTASAQANAEATKTLSSETKKLADNTKDAATQAKALKASQDEARRTKVAEDAVSAAITPLMRYNQAQADLRHLLNTGKITWAQYDAAMKAASKTYDEATSKSEDTLSNLSREVSTYGMASREITLYELAMRGATDATLAQAAGIIKQLNAMDEEKKKRDEIKKAQEEMAAEGKRMTEDNVSPLEKYAEGMKKLRDMVSAGAISVETAESAAKKLRAELEKPIDYQGIGAISKGSQAAFSLENQLREQTRLATIQRNLPKPDFAQANNFATELEQQQAAARGAISGGGAARPPGTGGAPITPPADTAAELTRRLIELGGSQNGNLAEIVRLLRERKNNPTVASL